MSDDPGDQPKRIGNWIWMALGIVLALFLTLLFTPLHGRGHREATRRANCISNLKQIGVALLTYHDAFKCFPPAYMTDSDGKPAHSWRVLLLPFFEDEKLKDLYQQYKLDEPWNSPSNSQLADKIPQVYRCPSSQTSPTSTGYVAVVGPETMWPGAKTIGILDIVDGTNRTISLVETSDPSFHWMEPRDLGFEQAIMGIQPAEGPNGFSSEHPNGANALFADCRVHFLQNDLPNQTLRDLLTTAGGEKVDAP